jgi:hypothetical protein
MNIGDHRTRDSINRAFAALAVVLLGATVTGCADTPMKPPSTTKTRAAAHLLRELAHLKAIKQESPTYTDYGPVTGSIGMTMTLIFNDATRTGTYEARASNGTIFGDISITTVANTEATGAASFAFEGHGTVTHGTGAYAHAYARDLEVSGEVASKGLFNMAVRGICYY